MLGFIIEIEIAELTDRRSLLLRSFLFALLSAGFFTADFVFFETEETAKSWNWKKHQNRSQNSRGIQMAARIRPAKGCEMAREDTKAINSFF